MSATYDTSCEPIVISKSLIDLLMKYDPKNWTDLYGLYSFYYYTAKWQKTDQIKCTTSYASKGTGWTENKIRKAKKDLIKLKLIKNIQRKSEDNNQIVGHYIKVNFIWSRTKAKRILNNIAKHKSHPNDFPEGGSTQSLASRGGNTLSNININALSNNSKNAYPPLPPAGETVCSEKKLYKNSDYGMGNDLPLKNKNNLFSDSLKLLPEKFRNQEFISIWRLWFKFRTEIKKKLTSVSMNRQINLLDKYSSTEAIKIIDRSIVNGWTGLFPDKQKNISTSEEKYSNRMKRCTTIEV